MIQPLIDKGGVELRVSDDISALPEFEGDAAKLGQAIGGLLHNAAKFTPKGGRYLFSALRTREVIRLGIEDTGIGMQPEEIKVVVRPFHRLAPRYGQHQGTGLGLPFAKIIVESHGGKLEITSVAGEGTRVEIVLPYAIKNLSHAA